MPIAQPIARDDTDEESGRTASRSSPSVASSAPPQGAGHWSEGHELWRATPHLMTVEQRRANHIASEQKRRQAIREQFNRLTELVPSLSPSQAKSEAMVLQKTLEHFHRLLEQRDRLRKQCEQVGLQVPQECVDED